MNWKKWKIGLAIAVACGVLNAGAGLAVGITWQAFVAVLCASLLTNLLTYLKNHPLEAIKDKAAGLCLGVLLGVSLWTLPACQTTQTPGRVLASSVLTVDAAMQGWWTWEALGRAKPEEIARVRAAYAQYQAAENIAETAYVTAAKLGDQAIWTQAATALRATQFDLLKLIESIQKKGTP